MLNYPQNYQMVKDVSILFYRISSIKLQMALPNLEGKKNQDQPVLQFFKLILFNWMGFIRKKSNQNHK